METIGSKVTFKYEPNFLLRVTQDITQDSYLRALHDLIRLYGVFRHKRIDLIIIIRTKARP
jgi:hypothetical protein